MVSPTPTSYYVDGEVVVEGEVVDNDYTPSATPSQAPSSLYPNGTDYAYLANIDDVVAEIEGLLAQTQAAATNGANSAAASQVSAEHAHDSEVASAASAAAALTSETNAAASDTSAAAHDAAAATSEANAATSETNAASSASDAAGSAIAAAGSASAASDSAAAAATSETNAASSASAAATSESNAAASASDASDSATAAAASEAGAAAAVQAAKGTATPLADGTAAVGTGTKWAREDHRHPTDTSRAANTPFVASGSSHAAGLVPDPGATAGVTKFLREDATWAVPPGSGGGGSNTFDQYEYSATAGQTSFSGSDSNGTSLAYTAGFIEVFVNGLKLNKGDYTATDGSSVVLGAAVGAGDLVTILAFTTFDVANTLAPGNDLSDVSDVDQARYNIKAIGPPDAIIEDQKASGTHGGGATSGSWVTKTLNTLVRNNNSVVANLSGSQFQLNTGSYCVRWRSPAYFCNLHKSLLKNATANTDVAFGSNEHSPFVSGGDMAMTYSEGVAIFTLATNSAFEIQHRVQTSAGTAGWGIACAFGSAPEIYTHVEIWKLD